MDRSSNGDSRISGMLLEGGLSVILGLLCLSQLASWLPHYLTWPYWCDHDVFAAMAQGWDAGLLPYRDLKSNNFPGQIYLFWILGKLFGWGRTVPLYAFDGALLLTFGIATLVWSKRLFGRFLPGWIGFAACLTYYLDLDYQLTAQRDSQATLFWATGLLIMQASGGKWGRFLGALLFALALLFRPQVVLITPAYAWSIYATKRNAGGGFFSFFRPTLAWACLVAAFVLLGFLPLIRDGLVHDLLESIKSNALGEGYSSLTPASAAIRFLLEISPLKVGATSVLSLILAISLGRNESRQTWVWVLAFAGGLAIYSLSPRKHDYLLHHEQIAWTITLALAAGWLLKQVAWPDLAKFAGVFLLLGLGVAIRPRMCQPSYCIDAIEAIKADSMPEQSPLGYLFPSYSRVPTYQWADYRDMINYLKSLDPDIKVANMIGVLAVASPSGHLTALPAESTSWLIAVNRKDEQAFADVLERAQKTVVVWVPENPPTEQEREGLLSEVVKKRYRPRAKFGMIEVWERK